jgi:hypothetical protein
MISGPRRARESGYAMLLVFLMAAVIAISLYNELPRVAFESQRAKEQLLIERGEQYKRAIQVFVRKMNRYPATIEELENTNGIRFLRKRYVDPMTGKDKWRLIHVNGGVLTDSIVQKPKTDKDGQPQSNTNTFIGEGPVMGAAADPNQQQMNPAMRRRASDSRPVISQEAQGPPHQAEEGQENGDNEIPDLNEAGNEETPAPGMPGEGQQIPGMPQPSGQALPGTFNGPIPNQPGMVQPGMPQPYTPGAVYPGQTVPGQMVPGQTMTGQPGSVGGGFPQPSYPGQSPTQTTGGVAVYPGQQPGAFPGQQQGVFPGQPQSAVYPGQTMGQTPGTFGQAAAFGAGGASPGFGGGAGMNPAMQAIQNALTSGRPGGMQGIPGMGGTQMGGGMPGMPGMGGTQMGGGIAGVASEAKDPSIIVYNERKKYNEWEFVYDQSKDRGLAGVMGGGVQGTPASQMGNMPQSGFGQQQTGFGSSPLGGNSSFGGGSSFGQSSPGFGQSTPQPPPAPPPQPQN